MLSLLFELIFFVLDEIRLGLQSEEGDVSEMNQ